MKLTCFRRLYSIVSLQWWVPASDIQFLSDLSLLTGFLLATLAHSPKPTSYEEQSYSLCRPGRTWEQ